MNLLTAQEVSRRIGIPVQSVYNLARQDIMPTVRIGRKVRFSEEAIDEWIASGGKSFAGGWKKEA